MTSPLLTYVLLACLIHFVNLQATEDQISELAFQSWRTLHLSPHLTEKDTGHKIIDSRIFKGSSGFQNSDASDVKRRSKRSTNNDSVDLNNGITVAELNDTHTTLVVHWAGEGSDVILALAKSPEGKSSALFVSEDYGKTFTDISSRFLVSSFSQAVIDQYYGVLGHNSHYVFADITNKCIFVTNNVMRYIDRHCNLPFVPQVLKLNSANLQNILGMNSDENGIRELFHSKDGGYSWTPILTKVKSFHWGIPPLDSSSTIYVQQETVNGISHVLKSVSPYLTWETLISDMTDFEFRSEYMIATKSVNLLGSHSGPSLQLWVSYKRGNFMNAEFPGQHNFTDYYLADASEGQLMVCATLNNTYTNLYVSDVTGYRFSLSLERIVYFNPKTMDRNWFRLYSNDTFADITKISGVSGIYIASQSTSNSSLNMNEQITLITYDKGGQWDLIDAPEFTIGGRRSNCQRSNNCYLHLTQQFSRLYLGSQSYPILSQESSPGLVIASGVLGNTMKGYPSMFVSSNAGVTWRQVLSGNYLFASADHGGIIVAVRQFEGTDEIFYSKDEGAIWESYKISKENIRVYGLLTEPGENTTIFSVFGSLMVQHSWRIIQVDFKDVFNGGKCGPSDYKMWSVNEDLPNNDGCLLGHVTQYQRRVAKAACYNGDDFVREVQLSNCNCTREDFECDYGYTEDRQRFCVKDTDVPDSDLHAIPSTCRPGTFYPYTRGYRKVAGDTCEGGQEHRYGPLQFSCPIQERGEFLLLTQEYKISMVNLATGRTTTLVQEPTIASVPAVFDYENNCVLFVDFLWNIQKSCFSGNSSDAHQHELIHRSGDSSSYTISSITFDWTAHNIFYTYPHHNNISVVNLEHRYERILYTQNNGVYSPQTIVADPHHGYLFFVGATGSSSQNYNIYQVVMDGSSPSAEPLANSSVVTRSTVLTLDLDNERLFFASGSSIYALEITNKTVTLLNHVYNNITGIGLYKNNIYMSSPSLENILITNLLHPSLFETFVSTSPVYGMIIVSNTSHHATSACSTFNHPCSQLCLPHPSEKSQNMNRTCLCGNGYNIIKSRNSNDEQCLCEAGERKQNDGTCIATNSSGCASDMFTCSNERCILLIWRCDGDDDCHDGSDEMDCTYSTCNHEQFTCRTGKCIPKRWVCDKEDDCKDGYRSDELSCANITCSATEQFTCNNGYCIQKSWQCDMDNDCHDGSDELNCESTNAACPPWQFTCTNEDCIDLTYKCNGHSECSDGSDEHNCTGAHCSPLSQFDCGDGHCIFETWRCDGMVDCSSGNDEMNCTLPETTTLRPWICSPSYSRCDNGNCVGYEALCNRVDDCGDLSDERGCGYTMITTTGTPVDSCPFFEFLCRADSTCLQHFKRCDGHEDCSDGTDEEECATHCSSEQYQCSVGNYTDVRPTCIWMEWVCDSAPDCPLGDDELNCDQDVRCSPSEFQCLKYGGCIPMSKHCDQTVDCGDGSDEVDCSYTAVNCSTFDNYEDACCGVKGCHVFVPLNGQWEFLRNQGMCKEESEARNYQKENRCRGTVIDSYTCGSGQFKCEDSRITCVSFVQVCDGHADCRNSQDEANCEEDGCTMSTAGTALFFLDSIANTSVSWEKMDNLDMVSYAEMMLGVPAANLTWRNHTLSNEENSKKILKVENLKPHTNYSFVFFKKSIQTGHLCFLKHEEYRTKEGIPSSPTYVKASTQLEEYVNPPFFSVTLQWRKPDAPNGEITNYVVYYQEVDSKNKPLSDIFSDRINSGLAERVNKIDYKIIVTEKIEADKTYQFWVSAENSAGIGPASEKVTLHVVQVPNTDLNVTVTKKNDSSFIVMWTKDPEAIGYNVTVIFDPDVTLSVARIPDIVKALNKTQLSVTIDSICPGTSVRVFVQAVYGNNTLGLVWYPKNIGQQLQMTGILPVISNVTVNKTDPTNVRLSYSLTSGKAQEYYIFYTHDKSKAPIMVKAYELTHEIIGLLACENYFIWIRPAFPTCPYSSLHNFITEEDPLAPPKNLASNVRRVEGHYNLTLTWNASCYEVSVAMDYIIKMKAENQSWQQVKTPDVTKDTHLTYSFPYVMASVSYTFTVRANLRGAQEGAPITVHIPSLDGPIDIVIEYMGDLKVNVRWRWPAMNDKEDQFKEFVVKVYDRESMVQTNHTSKTDISLTLPQSGTYFFEVEVRAQNDIILAVSQKVQYSVDALSSPSTDQHTSTNLVTIIVPVVAGVVLVLVVALVLVIVRHRQLQRSFLAFANSHYNIQSGTTTFSDDLDGDEPMIQGFSDDEPLVIA